MPSCDNNNQAPETEENHGIVRLEGIGSLLDVVRW